MAISVEQAILRMLEHTPILNSEQVPLEEAVGRSTGFASGFAGGG